MSFIKPAAAARRGFLVTSLSALLLTLLAPVEGVAQDVKQIRLTDKHIQGFIAAHEAMSKLYEGIDAGNSDPKIEKQAAAIVKKNGFANLEEHDVVSMNISMIMSGIDPQTKKFLEPPDQIKHDIALLKADKSVPEARKKEDRPARVGPQDLKADCVQGEHRAGAEILRQAPAALSGAGPRVSACGSGALSRHYAAKGEAIWLACFYQWSFSVYLPGLHREGMATLGGHDRDPAEGYAEMTQ